MTQPTPDSTPPAEDDHDAQPRHAPETPETPGDGPPPPEERPIPIGCHPFTFGIVAATIQFALTIWLMRSC